MELNTEIYSGFGLQAVYAGHTATAIKASVQPNRESELFRYLVSLQSPAGACIYQGTLLTKSTEDALKQVIDEWMP